MLVYVSLLCLELSIARLIGSSSSVDFGPYVGSSGTCGGSVKLVRDEGFDLLLPLPEK